jgi:hypothetical protein
MKEATLQELFEQLRKIAKQFPAYIEKVDADVSDKPELWGTQCFRVVLPFGKGQIWIKEAESK